MLPPGLVGTLAVDDVVAPPDRVDVLLHGRAHTGVSAPDGLISSCGRNSSAEAASSSTISAASAARSIRRRSSEWPRVTASFDENSLQQSSSGRIEMS